MKTLNETMQEKIDTCYNLRTQNQHVYAHFLEEYYPAAGINSDYSIPAAVAHNIITECKMYIAGGEFPSTIRTCPFCWRYIFSGNNCYVNEVLCSYGKHFGRCRDTGSHFEQVSDKIYSILRRR